MTDPIQTHLSAERMQAFLEGDLPPGERRPFEEHLTACVRCSTELETWRELFTDLSALATPAPRADFADLVMARVHLSEPKRSWVTALFPRRSAHVSSDVLQDVADGLVPARRVARIRSHVETCTSCGRELEAWEGVLSQLARIERFSPRPDFATQVMAAVRTRVAPAVPTRAAARAPAWAPVAARSLVLVQRFVPRTRRAWAVLSGVAVTPAAIFALVAYAVLSHPTLTPEALLSFALWQLGDLFATAWNSLTPTGLGFASVSTAESLLDVLAGNPMLVAGAAMAYSALAAFAARILYRNLLGSRHVRVPVR